jgi:hypothetical protein
MRQLLVTSNDVPVSPILVTLMMEALHSSETPALARATRRDIPVDVILHVTLVGLPELSSFSVLKCPVINISTQFLTVE